MMTDRQSPPAQDTPRLFGRVSRRAKRLIGPTLGVFGRDSDGRLLPVPEEPGERSAARSQVATEKDDHARVAIAEAELETDRREKQQAPDSRPAPSRG